MRRGGRLLHQAPLLHATALLALLAVVWQPSSGARGSEDASSRLLSCYNGDAKTPGQEHAAPATFQDFLQGLPPRLTLHRVLWSAQRSDIPLTIATAVTPSRLKALEAQCASWKGPLAAALYLPLEAAATKLHGQGEEAAARKLQGQGEAGLGDELGPGEGSMAEAGAGRAPGADTRSPPLSVNSLRQLKEAEADAREVFERAEARSGCQLRLLVLYEVFAPAAPAASAAADEITAPATSRRLSDELPRAASAAEEGSGGSSDSLAGQGSRGGGRRAQAAGEEDRRGRPRGGDSSGGDALMRSLLPINSLRNAAVLAADTPLVAMVDVDLLISHSLSKELANPVRARTMLQAAARRNVFILPAFETMPQLGIERGSRVARQAVAGDKGSLQQLLVSQQVITFAAQLYTKGHACTRFRTWFDSMTTYATELTTNCEPWFAIQRHLSPQYDVRFRGYGWNKVSQVAHVASSNFTLLVHPSAFLVHMPHPSSRAMSAYMASDRARAAQKARAWEQQQAQRSQQGRRGAGVAGQGRVGQRQGRGQGQGRVVQEPKGQRRRLAGLAGADAAEGQQGISASRRPRLPSAAARAFHRRVSDLREQVLAQLASGQFEPVVDEASLRCRSQLPWWQDEGPP